MIHAEDVDWVLDICARSLPPRLYWEIRALARAAEAHDVLVMQATCERLADMLPQPVGAEA